MCSITGYLPVVPYFDEPVGRVKIQTTSKSSRRYYTSKRLIRFLLSNDFFSQNSNLPSFLTFTRPVGMRRVQISCDLCTPRFARYLYSTKQSWIIKHGILSNVRVKHGIVSSVNIQYFFPLLYRLLFKKVLNISISKAVFDFFCLLIGRHRCFVGKLQSVWKKTRSSFCPKHSSCFHISRGIKSKILNMLEISSKCSISLERSL